MLVELTGHVVREVELNPALLVAVLRLGPFALPQFFLLVLLVNREHHFVVTASAGHVNLALHNDRITLARVAVHKRLHSFHLLF